jgi:hypothetical protein
MNSLRSDSGTARTRLGGKAQVWLEKIRSGEEPLAEKQKPILRRAMAAAKKLEKKYGRKNLGWEDFEWVLLRQSFPNREPPRDLRKSRRLHCQFG